MTAAPHYPKMFPLMLNITDVAVMVVGDNMTERLDMLREYGAANVHTFAHATPPNDADFDRIKPRLVFISDADDALATDLHKRAHAAGAFVHVQDRIPLCDFHLPARIRRGHLQVTISTDGSAAGLSRVLRQHLEETKFGPEWADRVDEVAAARQQWKAEGRSMSEIGKALVTFVVARGWLKP